MKIVKIGAALLLLLALLLVAFVLTKKPKARQPSDVQFARNDEIVKRGEYLARHVLGCMSCHSPRDWTIYGAPVIEARLGAGGECLTPKEKMPGTICMSNITPHPETGIGAWSDDELARAIREGVDAQGTALFPLMPYPIYRHLADEDVQSVVVYLRSIPPIDQRVPDPIVEFPMSFIMKMIPTPLDRRVAAPPASDPVSYGEYLARVGGCHSCHTPVDDRNLPLEGRDFAGGQIFLGPWGSRASTNLTPHPSGLGGRSKEAFIGMFEAYSSTTSEPARVEPTENTPMHWQEAAGMTERDLGAIYDFLQTVTPQQ